MAGKPLITDADRLDMIKKKAAEGQQITKDDILSIRDAPTRQKLIAENIRLFVKEK